MSTPEEVDGLLVHWGDRLFYPGNRSKKTSTPRLHAVSARAAAVRERIAATLVRAPQVMVKVTGGGRGMRAIAAHFRYISKNGRLEIEDERGGIVRGKEGVVQLVEDWKWGGSPIADEGHRREAFNIMLSMPRGTDPLIVQRAAREFARTELGDHKFVMVLHDHQANPHVHLSVRAESIHGKRLNPRKQDLSRWRETFADKLRSWGIEAEASRRHVRGQRRGNVPLWQLKAQAEGRREAILARKYPDHRRGFALTQWRGILDVLSRSSLAGDASLARDVRQFIEARSDRTTSSRDVGEQPPRDR